jgi:hypothetical protein
VAALIDSNSCAAVSTGDLCGDDATSYYHEFEYNGQRVVISSGIPNHVAEQDAVKPNPNVRCEHWQYVVLPLSPEVNAVGSSFRMGTTGWATSGGVFYDHRSSPQGALAAYYEIDSLDSCLGHSDQNKNYHYHLTPVCIANGTDATVCQQVGYMDDGIAIHGLCNGFNGAELSSCWTQTTNTTGDNISDFYWDEAAYDSGLCSLDSCGGAYDAAGNYAYYTSSNMPYVPICRMGTTTATACGITG